ncbi:hypothetical protein BS47DRAFT_1367564 [Hydnum rufescens UP504]|uniref:Uncharacterized protein n=1 Tax=Hydnum rufescens UP504 TaxID=1448309 RepID=A0A9P6DQ09_9AGAM|nr:hypothetical protein BS47DRAFT_1367564 [Hydnum rufescens UP504]
MCDPFPSSCFSSGLYRALQSRHSTLFFSDGSEDDVVSNEPSQWKMKTTAANRTGRADRMKTTKWIYEVGGARLTVRLANIHLIPAGVQEAVGRTPVPFHAA